MTVVVQWLRVRVLGMGSLNPGKPFFNIFSCNFKTILVTVC